MPSPHIYLWRRAWFSKIRFVYYLLKILKNSMKKLLGTLYWGLCRRIGYIITLRDYYDPKTFTLIKKNSHMALLKHIGKVDEHGHIRVKEVWQIQIKKI